MTFPFLLLWSEWAIFALRVFVGALFLAHGLPKLKNLKGTGEWFQSVGFKPRFLIFPRVLLPFLTLNLPDRLQRLRTLMTGNLWQKLLLGITCLS